MDRPDAVAVVDQDDQVTFAQLKQWSNALAAHLIDEGLATGDRVSALAANSLQYAVLAHAVMRAGGILCSINPRSTAKETEYLLQKYEPSFVIADEAGSSAADEALARVNGPARMSMDIVEDFRSREASPVSERVSISPDDVLVIIGTSGSTGRPKGVMWSHRSITSYIMEFSLAEPQATDHPKLMLFAPLAVSAGYLLLMQFPAYGGTTHIAGAFDPQKCLDDIVRHRITSVMGVPVFLEGIANCPGFEDADLSHVRVTSVGGARVSEELVATYLKKGIALRQIYGQTEVGGQCTINPTSMVSVDPNKCGRGMPLTRMKIVDAEGNEQPAGEPGEILVKGPGCMVGYWRDEEETRKTVIDGWIHTGDQGVMDETGLLTFLDRIKDIIISGGLNISAAELERVAMDYPGITEVVAIAAKDDKFGETPMLVVYAKSEIDVQALIAHFNGELSDYKIPRYIAFEPEPLIRLSGGKIDKTSLRQKYANAHMELPRVR